MNRTIILAALALTALLASCTRTEVSEELPFDDMDIEIIVPELGNDPVSKAAKSNWESGDKIKMWYNANRTQLPDLVIKYDGSKWSKDGSATVSGNAITSSGTLNAVYENSADGMSGYRYVNNSNYSLWSFYSSDISFKNDSHKVYNTGIVAYSTGNSFNIAPNRVTGKRTLTATLGGWMFTTNVQEVITGLTYTSTNWYMQCDNLYVPSAFGINSDSTMSFLGYVGTEYVMSWPNTDGRAWYFSVDNEVRREKVYTFTVSNKATGKNYTYSTTGSIPADWTKMHSIKIPWSKFSEVTE